LVTAILLFSKTSFAQKTTESRPDIQLGYWYGVLTLNDSTELPFTFTVNRQPGHYLMTIQNAEEDIPVEDLSVTKDSVKWRMPVFDSGFKCKIDSLNGFHGTFYNYAASKP